MVMKLFIQTSLINFGDTGQNANWPVIFRIPKWVFFFFNFNCSGKVLLLIEWLILTKKNSGKISAFDISKSEDTFLTSSRLYLQGF